MSKVGHRRGLQHDALLPWPGGLPRIHPRGSWVNAGRIAKKLPVSRANIDVSVADDTRGNARIGRGGISARLPMQVIGVGVDHQ